MPVTPLHLLPAVAVYLFFSRRIHAFAFFAATLLIDAEPALHLVFGVPTPQIPLLFGGTSTGLHTLTHNPFGIVLLVAPAMTVLAKTFETLTHRWQIISRDTGQEERSLRSIYLSAVFGASIHLGWDLTMHHDINLAFPFYSLPNPFVNPQTLDLIWNASLFLIPVALVLLLIMNRRR